MYTKTAVLNACSLLGGAIIGCTLFAGDVVAQGDEVRVAYQVSTQGLDLSKAAGARELYRRLKHAAVVVCTRADRTGQESPANLDACSEKALGEAIRFAQMPSLVQVYLETHSLGQAAAQGIDVRSQPATE
jgi:UrcA family protein